MKPLLVNGARLALSLLACRQESSHPRDAVTSPPDAAPLTDVSRDPDAAASLSHYIVQKASFALSEVTLKVVDLHMSKRLDDVLSHTSASVVVNGGFFGEDGEPVGLTVSEGHPLGRFSPQMSGGVL